MSLIFLPVTGRNIPAIRIADILAILLLKESIDYYSDTTFAKKSAVSIFEI